MKIPWDIEDAKQLGRVLDHYKDKYYFEVVLTVVVTYLLYPFKLNRYFIFLLS